MGKHIKKDRSPQVQDPHAPPPKPEKKKPPQNEEDNRRRPEKKRQFNAGDHTPASNTNTRKAANKRKK